MYNCLIKYLKSYKKSTITLGDLEKLVSGEVTYNEFAKTIKKLVKNKILIEKNIKNNNGKEIPLPYKFGVNKYEINKEYISSIQKYGIKFNKEINLQEYFNLDETVWKKDLIYIKKINTYLEKNGLPKEHVTSQERSFNIVGDEKWIDEKGGKTILERIGVWNKLNIISNSDPLMLAINPEQFSSKEYYHLVVENKATFLALIDSIKDTKFTSLIWGSGWKIVSNITMLEKQLGINGKHRIYYFGDLDNEGISIWNSLNEKQEVFLGTEFYKKLISKKYSIGKENQLQNQLAIENFLEYFSPSEKIKIKEILKNGGYLPQEALDKNELQHIWRNSKWI